MLALADENGTEPCKSQTGIQPAAGLLLGAKEVWWATQTTVVIAAGAAETQCTTLSPCCQALLSEVDSAPDRNHVPRDVIGLRRTEEVHAVGRFFRRSQSSERNEIMLQRLQQRRLDSDANLLARHLDRGGLRGDELRKSRLDTSEGDTIHVHLERACRHTSKRRPSSDRERTCW